MKLPASSFLALAHLASNAFVLVGADEDFQDLPPPLPRENEDLFSVVTNSDTWETCGLTPANDDNCHPTVPIELAACEADLVVYGRVITIEDDGSVEISVDYQSRLFNQPRKKIPKYGAGLDNQVNGTDFYDDSGFFTTHITGFMPPDTRFSDPPCGTLLPRSNDELYFFLKALPENEGVEAKVGDDAVLSVNLQLSTTVLRSGTAPADAWDYVEEGIFVDDFKLNGDCQAVYCCYNPDCADCEGVLEKFPGFSCPEWTEIQEVDESGATAATAVFVVSYSSKGFVAAAVMALGLVARLL